MTSSISTKQLHAHVTTLAGRSLSVNPQEIYREIYANLTEIGLNLDTLDKKQTKLGAVVDQGYIEPFLENLHRLTKVRKTLGNMIESPEPQVFKYNGIRHYRVANGASYPSVTTIISHGDKNKDYIIKKWKARLVEEFGEEQAQIEMKKPTEQGNYTHACIEAYLRSSMRNQDFINDSLAVNILPFFDEIKKVVACELPLYSVEHQFAGRVDAILEMKDGRTFIVDFKTSTPKRTPSNCKDYFQQAAAYSIAFEELHGIKVDGLLLAVMYREKQGVREEDLLAKFHGVKPRKELMAPVWGSILVDMDLDKHRSLFLEKVDAFYRGYNLHSEASF